MRNPIKRNAVAIYLLLFVLVTVTPTYSTWLYFNTPDDQTWYSIAFTFYGVAMMLFLAWLWLVVLDIVMRILDK